MRLVGRAALLAALLLLAQLHPGSSQWTPEEASARVQDRSLRSSPRAPNQGGEACELLLQFVKSLAARRGTSGRGPGGRGSETSGKQPQRQDPQLSIDVSLQLLQNLLKLENQKELEEQNRLILESVGK